MQGLPVEEDFSLALRAPRLHATDDCCEVKAAGHEQQGCLELDLDMCTV